MNYVDTYSEVKKHKPETLRSKIRKFVLDGLSLWDNIKGIEKELNMPKVQFLYIHHVFKDEELALEKLLKRLRKNHEFISYSEGVNKILEGKIDKPYICFSSDDGFKNNVRAAEILSRHNAKACFFINPSLIGNVSYHDIEKHCRVRLDFPPVEFLNWDEVEKIQRMGHEFGSHTMEHMNVANAEKQVFQEDCEKTYEILKKHCGEAKHFAFPYGRFFHFNQTAYETVFNTGFVSCATAERGCHVNHGKALSYKELYIRRDHVILDWNIDHVFHFLANNAKRASTNNNLFAGA